MCGCVRVCARACVCVRARMCVKVSALLQDKINEKEAIILELTDGFMPKPLNN